MAARLRETIIHRSEFLLVHNDINEPNFALLPIQIHALSWTEIWNRGPTELPANLNDSAIMFF